MTPRQMQIAFERELNTQIDDSKKPTSDTTVYWLNQALMKFVKTRHSGVNAKQLAFEQDAKRIDDLRTLVVTVNVSAANSPLRLTEWSVRLPDEYMFHLGTKVNILPLDGTNNKCWKKDATGNYLKVCTSAIEVTADTISRALENSLSEHRLHYCNARPLQLFKGSYVMFYTDGNYKISDCDITYLKKPTAITFANDSAEYTDLPEHTHQEIVKLAVQMYLESIADQRYTSYSNEVNTME